VTPLGPAAADAGRRPGLTPITLFLTLLVAYVAIEVQLVLILVLMALVLATAIERPIQLLERRRLPRPFGILAIYVAIIGAVSLVFVIGVPIIAGEAVNFNEELPQRLDNLTDQWQVSANPFLSGPGADFLREASGLVRQPKDIPVPQLPAGSAFDVVSGIVGGLVGLVTIFVIAFYYLMEKRWLRRLVLEEIAPDQRTRVGRVWDNVEAKVGDWLRGQLLLCLVIGLLATVGYGIMGVPFWPLLGLWAGVTEIVPVVGPWLGGVPAVVVALTQSWNTAFVVIAFIFVLQGLENTILVPRVMRGAVGLTPLTVFVAILAGTQFRGIVGALLAIPVAAAVQVVLTDYLDVRRNAQADRLSPASAWRWMRGPLSANQTSATAGPASGSSATSGAATIQATEAMFTPADPPVGVSPVSPSTASASAPSSPATPSAPASPVARWAEVLARAVKRPEGD